MPPALLLLQDISLTFGVMRLLSGAALAVALHRSYRNGVHSSRPRFLPCRHVQIYGAGATRPPSS